MKKVLIGIGGVVVVLIAAAIIIPLFIPVERYKSEITTRTEAATGRQLAIDGPVSLSLFPSIALSAEDVHFANRPGGRAKDMATLDRLRVSVKLLPLLTGNLQIDGFELVNPVIALEVDKNGVGNWVMGEAAPAADTQDASASKGGGAPSFLTGLSLGDVRLVNGKISYFDEATGKDMAVDNINANLSLPAFDKTFTADGSLDWQGETIKLALALDNPQGLLDGKDQDLTLSITSSPVSFSLSGSARMAESPSMNGHISLDIPSIRNLAAWAGTPLTLPGDGLGPLKISGTLDYQAPKMAFSDAQIALDDMKATGSLTVDTGGARPKVGGRLDVDTLDLNPYLPPPPKEKTRLVWSEEPIDASGLKAADLDFVFTTDRIQVRNIAIGQSELTLKIDDGVMTAALKKMALYDGSGSGNVRLDGRKPALGLAADFTLDGVQAEPLMKDAAEMDRISGGMSTDFKITASGASQKDLISTLNGGGAVKFSDGEIRGVDLAKIAATIERVVNGVSDNGGGFLQTLLGGDILGSLSNLGAMFGGKGEVDQTTKFTSLNASWTANNGVITNKDLELLGPLVNNRALLRMTGEGTIGLPDQTLDYRAELRSFSQADATDTTGVGGVVRLTGTIAEPNPCVVVGSLCVGRNTKPTDLLGSKLLGGGGDEKSSSPEDTIKSIGKGLKGLFGGSKDKE